MSESSKARESSDKKDSKNINISFSMKKRHLLIGGIGLATVAVLTFGFSVLIPTKLESAYASCKSESRLFEFYSTLDPDGKALYLDGAGEESKGLLTEDLSCAISEVGVPESVISRMNGTTALMGQQEATFNGITARWFYHPSNGLDISFETN